MWQVIRLLVNDGDFLVRTSRNKKSNESQIVLSVMWSGHKHFIVHGEPGVLSILVHRSIFVQVCSSLNLMASAECIRTGLGTVLYVYSCNR